MLSAGLKKISTFLLPLAVRENKGFVFGFNKIWCMIFHILFDLTTLQNLVHVFSHVMLFHNITIFGACLVMLFNNILNL